jgi:fatty acid desaturase
MRVGSAALATPSHPPGERTETDGYAGVIPARLPVATVRALSTIRPAASLLAVTFEWVAIILAILLYERLANLWFLPVVVMWIGARQHALGVLMHEGTHYHLLRNRTANDIVSELFLAWPLFVTMKAYRRTHFAHHRHVNTDRDPDMVRKQNAEWEFPQSAGALALLLLKDLSGWNTYQQLMEAADMSDTSTTPAAGVDYYRIARLSYYVVIAALVVYFGLWRELLLFWLLPALTWLKVILRVRSIAEHYGIANDHVYTQTRTTLPSLLERLFVAPLSINYHLEHHLYPSVPFFRLRRLHTALMADAQFRATAHLTQTYIGVLRECVKGS